MTTTRLRMVDGSTYEVNEEGQKMVRAYFDGKKSPRLMSARANGGVERESLQINLDQVIAVEEVSDDDDGEIEQSEESIYRRPR